MPERFTETLRAASEPGWSHAVGHRFVKELFAGAMPDAVMARYLIQDHRFLDSFLILLGAPPTHSRPGFASVASSGRCRARRTPISSAHSKHLASRRIGARLIPIRRRPPASRRSCARRRKRAAMPLHF